MKKLVEEKLAKFDIFDSIDEAAAAAGNRTLKMADSRALYQSICVQDAGTRLSSTACRMLPARSESRILRRQQSEETCSPIQVCEHELKDKGIVAYFQS